MIRGFCGRRPRVHPGAYVDRVALVIGDVTLEEGVNVWPGAVIRGDVEPIHIGKRSSIQDNVVVHTDPGYPVTIGEGCTIAHGCIIHGCRVGNNSLIAMGTTLLTGAEVGERCLVGAGTVLPEGKAIPAGSVAMGIPARVIRPVSEDDLSRMGKTNDAYQRLMRLHRG